MGRAHKHVPEPPQAWDRQFGSAGRGCRQLSTIVDMSTVGDRTALLKMTEKSENFLRLAALATILSFISYVGPQRAERAEENFLVFAVFSQNFAEKWLDSQQAVDSCGRRESTVGQVCEPGE